MKEEGWSEPVPCKCGGELMFNDRLNKSAHTHPMCETYETLVSGPDSSFDGLLLLESEGSVAGQVVIRPDVKDYS